MSLGTGRRGQLATPVDTRRVLTTATERTAIVCQHDTFGRQKGQEVLRAMPIEKIAGVEAFFFDSGVSPSQPWTEKITAVLRRFRADLVSGLEPFTIQ